MNKKWFGSILGAALTFGSLFAAEWTVEETFKVKNVSDVQVSPDGKEVVYTIALPVIEKEKSQWRSEVYLSKSDGSSAKKIADGRAPEWSPDGQWIAYISQPNHLSMVSSKDGTSRSLAELSAPVIDYHWSPDSKEIGFTMPAPIQLWTIAIDGESQPKQLTEGPYEIKTAFPSNTFDWSPDGSEIVFLYHTANSPYGLHHADLAKVEVASGKVTELLVDEKVKCNPLYSPDGEKISCVVGESFLASSVFILPSQGGQPTILADTPNKELFFTGKVIGWASNSKTLYLSETKGTLNELYTLPLNGEPPISLRLSNRLNQSFALNASGTHLGFVLGNLSIGA
ncbi:MAG: Dipeptidyl-peptidase 5 [Chlamydiae bacterium]|nr:Dipeptidyl-peptidase 5 [Chlamydiota bacterium]